MSSRYLFCHHRAGTLLLGKCFAYICTAFQWKMQIFYGHCPSVPKAEIVMFAHSLVDVPSLPASFRGVHVIRDPRDIIVSGYLYHKRCQEAWCVNTNFDETGPIFWPRVPYSQQHRSEIWKREYLRGLGNKSYQQNLLDRDESDGLLFEMAHYGAWTIDNMLAWNYQHPSIKEIRFERLMSRYDETFRDMFTHFEFSDAQTAGGLELIAKEDISRMKEEQRSRDLHITGPQPAKWREFFKDVHKDAFKKRFGDALVRLGYEESDQW